MDWTNKNLSQIAPIKRLNYLDIEKVLRLLEGQHLLKKEEKTIYINSSISKQCEEKLNLAVIGPSHVYNWSQLISKKSLEEPKYIMYGDPGLSLCSESFDTFLKWWIGSKNNKAVIIVPDFRIGNPSLVRNNNLDELFGKGIFINKDQVSKENDFLMKDLALSQLDKLVSKYSNNIKFIFWSLYGRERTNIKAKKYIVDDIYIHPVWNYSFFKEKYSQNIVDLSMLGDNIFDLIDLDGSIHPNQLGYEFLKNQIDKIEW